MRCQSCGREIPAQARFCGHCGAVVQAPGQVPSSSAPDPEPVPTVMLPRRPTPAPDQPLPPYQPATHSGPEPWHHEPEPSRYESVAGPLPSPPTNPYAPWQAPSNGQPAPPASPPTQQYPAAPPPTQQYPAPQYPPAEQHPAVLPYRPHPTQQRPSPRKRLPTPVIVILGIVGALFAGLLLLGGLGAYVYSRTGATPTAQPTATVVATAKPAAATAKPAPSPTSTPRPSPTPVPAPTRVPVSLPNGTDVTPPAPGEPGLGKLTIKNGTSRDAVAKLVTGEADPKTWQTQRFVYVKANNSVTMEGIRVGTYRLAFMSGVDWDADGRKFLRETSSSLFDDTFEFKEEKTERGTRFSTVEVTLNPVAGGTATTSALPEGAFGPE